MKYPNQYRLVYIRPYYDECSYDRPVSEKDMRLETFTKWRHFDGATVNPMGAMRIEFRHKAE